MSGQDSRGAGASGGSSLRTPSAVSLRQASGHKQDEHVPPSSGALFGRGEADEMLQDLLRPAFRPDVTLEMLRKQLARFAEERDWNQFHTPRNLLLALVGEVGELAELFQWRPDEQVRRGLPGFSREDRKSVEEELSDVLLYLVRLADMCGVDLGQAACDKIRKNAAKYPADKCKGSAAKYTAYQQQHRQGQGQQQEQGKGQDVGQQGQQQEAAQPLQGRQPPQPQQQQQPQEEQQQGQRRQQQQEDVPQWQQEHQQQLQDDRLKQRQQQDQQQQDEQHEDVVLVHSREDAGAASWCGGGGGGDGGGGGGGGKTNSGGSSGGRQPAAARPQQQQAANRQQQQQHEPRQQQSTPPPKPPPSPPLQQQQQSSGTAAQTATDGSRLSSGRALGPQSSPSTAATARAAAAAAGTCGPSAPHPRAGSSSGLPHQPHGQQHSGTQPTIIHVVGMNTGGGAPPHLGSAASGGPGGAPGGPPHGMVGAKRTRDGRDGTLSAGPGSASIVSSGAPARAATLPSLASLQLQQQQQHQHQQYPQQLRPVHSKASLGALPASQRPSERPAAHLVSTGPLPVAAAAASRATGAYGTAAAAARVLDSLPIAFAGLGPQGTTVLLSVDPSDPAVQSVLGMAAAAESYGAAGAAQMLGLGQQQGAEALDWQAGAVEQEGQDRAERRRRFTEDELELLSQHAKVAGWQLANVPSEERDRICEELGITRSQLQNFFSNHRPVSYRRGNVPGTLQRLVRDLGPMGHLPSPGGPMGHSSGPGGPMGQSGGYGLARQDSGGTMAVSGSGSGMSAGMGGGNGGGGVSATAGGNSMKAEPGSVGRVGIIGLSYRGGGGGRGDGQQEDSAAGELYGVGVAEYGGMPYGRQYKPPSPDGERAGADGGGSVGRGRGGEGGGGGGERGGGGQPRWGSRDSRDTSQ